jgi:hypothetical protein
MAIAHTCITGSIGAMSDVPTGGEQPPPPPTMNEFELTAVIVSLLEATGDDREIERIVNHVLTYFRDMGKDVGGSL